MELRAYQKNIINKLKLAFNNGYKSPVIVLGCGGGKSIVCADIAKSATLKKMQFYSLCIVLNLLNK